MHDPMTVAFEIKSPFKNKYGERKTLITIWHVDPCNDGTDDSCGWFMRSRHGDQKKINEIKKEFEFYFKHNYWFDKEGKQIFSTIGTMTLMYSTATWIYFERNRKKQKQFMEKHLYDIIQFAENPIDCGGDSITNKWNETTEDRFGHMAGMVFSDICRKSRRWYQHPKWHINHWKIQFRFIKFKKRKSLGSNSIDQNLRDTV